MSSKNFMTVAAVIFLAVAVLHLSRLVFGWSAAIAGWDVPQWASVVGVVVAGYLSYTGFRICHKS